MYKDGVITISDWQKGMADSAILGFETFKGCDIFENPGTVRMANRPELTYSGYSGIPVAYVVDTVNGGDYTLTTDGNLYKNGTTLIQGALGVGCDLLIYKDYLWITTQSNNVNLYGPLSSSPTFLGSFKTLTSSNYYHKLLAGRDDIVYITNGNDIASVQNFTPAAPFVMPSGTYTSAALTLQYGFYAVTMCELGKWLMVGTQKGSNYFDGPRYKFANIFPWDRTLTSFENPIKINEAGMQAMISDNNRMFFVAGTNGSVYVADTSNYQKIKQIPWISERPYAASVRVYPNAIAFNNNSNLLIGLTTEVATFGNPQYKPKIGIYEINQSKDYPTALRYVPSTGGDGATNPLSIGFIDCGSGDTTVFGWRDNNTYGIDQATYRTTTDYTTMIESALFTVGTKLNKKTFKNIEFTLTKPLVDYGQSVRISYRKNIDDDYTLIGTYDYATVGSSISYTAPANIADCEILQVKIEITQSPNVVYGYNVNLLSVRIW